MDARRGSPLDRAKMAFCPGGFHHHADKGDPVLTPRKDGKANLKPPPARKGQGTPQGKAPCPFFAKGHCRNGAKCPDLHQLAITDGPQAKPPKTPNTKPEGPKGQQPNTGKAKADKGKGKGKPKAEPPTKEQREEMSKQDCNAFARGQCKFGDRCCRRHGPDDEPLVRMPCLRIAHAGIALSYSPANVDLEEFALDTGTGVDVCRKGMKGRRIVRELPNLTTVGGGGGASSPIRQLPHTSPRSAKMPRSSNSLVMMHPMPLQCPCGRVWAHHWPMRSIPTPIGAKYVRKDAIKGARFEVVAEAIERHRDLT